jgi:hypothetical protein
LTDFDRAVQAAIDIEFAPGATPVPAQTERIRHMVAAAITALTQAAAERVSERKPNPPEHERLLGRSP